MLLKIDIEYYLALKYLFVCVNLLFTLCSFCCPLFRMLSIGFCSVKIAIFTFSFVLKQPSLSISGQVNDADAVVRDTRMNMSSLFLLPSWLCLCYLFDYESFIFFSRIGAKCSFNKVLIKWWSSLFILPLIDHMFLKLFMYFDNAIFMT
jgi:hypothetical protein